MPQARAAGSRTRHMTMVAAMAHIISPTTPEAPRKARRQPTTGTLLPYAFHADMVWRYALGSPVTKAATAGHRPVTAMHQGTSIPTRQRSARPKPRVASRESPDAGTG